jgi:hypothetical protein
LAEEPPHSFLSFEVDGLNSIAKASSERSILVTSRLNPSHLIHLEAINAPCRTFEAQMKDSKGANFGNCGSFTNLSKNTLT